MGKKKTHGRWGKLWSIRSSREAHRKGFRGFDAERVYVIQTTSQLLKSDWETYMKYGYLPTDLIQTESVSSTLESVYDDHAVDMAKRMGKEEDAAFILPNVPTLQESV